MGRSQRVDVAVLLGVVLWMLSGPLPQAHADEAVTRSFSSGGGQQTFVVPAGVSEIGVRAIGGRGSARGVESPAAEAEGELSVTPGETLYVEVGGNGEGVEGGSNGGGDGGGSRKDHAGGGGGASDLRTSPFSAGLSPDTRLIVAGGSGGEGSTGAHGGTAGAAGQGGPNAAPGQAGSQSAGGQAGAGSECFEMRAETTIEASTYGSLGQGGTGELCFARFSGSAAGGGGGGGYYGGGGGGAFLATGEESVGTEGAGGGGGSSLVPEGGTVRLAGDEAEPGIAISFIEPENPPVAVTSAATGVHSTSAQLEGTVNPEEREVSSCEFEWGTTTEYGHSTPCSPAPGSGGFPVTVAAVLKGLATTTTYHYRLVAANDRGTSYGQDAELTTPAHEKPAVTGFSPQIGPKAGGTAVTITGTELQYVTQLLFGQKAAAFELVSPTELRTVTPAQPCGCYEPIEVVDDLGDHVVYFGNGFHYVAPPVVTGLSVKKGPAAGGTQVVVTGGSLETASEVLFGSAPATIESHKEGSLTVRTEPSPAGKYEVFVVTPGGTSAASTKAAFKFEGPVVSGVAPSSGARAGGIPVTVTGAGFKPGLGSTGFSFGKGAASAVECASTTQCTMVLPAAAKAGTVDVRASFGKKSKKTAADRFTYE